MRSFFITAALATAALALSACHDRRRPEPVPPPQSLRGTAPGPDSLQAAPDAGTAGTPCPSRRLFSF